MPLSARTSNGDGPTYRASSWTTRAAPYATPIGLWWTSCPRAAIRSRTSISGPTICPYTTPEVTQRYREARRIAQANEEGNADTEDLRQAVTSYRSLVQALLDGDGDGSRRDETRREQDDTHTRSHARGTKRLHASRTTDK